MIVMNPGRCQVQRPAQTASWNVCQPADPFTRFDRIAEPASPLVAGRLTDFGLQFLRPARHPPAWDQEFRDYAVLRNRKYVVQRTQKYAVQRIPKSNRRKQSVHETQQKSSIL